MGNDASEIFMNVKSLDLFLRGATRGRKRYATEIFILPRPTLKRSVLLAQV